MPGTWRLPPPLAPARRIASPKGLEARSLRVAELEMAVPNAPNVPDLGIDFVDEFAHLGQMTEFAGRVGEALVLVINRSSDRCLDVSRTMPSAQGLAVEPSAVWGRVAECRITSVAPGWPVSRSDGPAYLAASKSG
jgi:hypothetical protein